MYNILLMISSETRRRRRYYLWFRTAACFWQTNQSFANIRLDRIFPEPLAPWLLTSHYQDAMLRTTYLLTSFHGPKRFQMQWKQSNWIVSSGLFHPDIMPRCVDSRFSSFKLIAKINVLPDKWQFHSLYSLLWGCFV